MTRERFTITFQIDIQDEDLEWFTTNPAEYLACNWHHDSTVDAYPANPDSVSRKLEKIKNETY